MVFLSANTSPGVSITNVSQRTDTSRKVDIYYNISHTMPVTVTLQVSSDNGVNWNLPCTLVTGDIGSNISPGNGKHIVWDVLAEHPDVIYENMHFKVMVDDMHLPYGFVLVQGGVMSPTPSYTVTLSPFYIEEYEVTQDKYQIVMGTNPSQFSGNPNRPVERVSWFKAIEYCNRRSMQEGLMPCYSYSTYGTDPNFWPSGWNTHNINHSNVSCNWNANGYRLPTEMEWMFAAKGGNQSLGYPFSGSNSIDDVAWYYNNSYAMGSSDPDYGTHNVGLKQANELGIFDMSGNVREWCWDIYGSYPNGSFLDPKGAVSGTLRMGRGGAWNLDLAFSTVFSRNNYAGAASAGSGNFGIRCVRAFQ
ncbi:MAG: formylglycine-generating enzyme family protein [Candidatus Cloacimonetes bacterium]|nr:formylglycine-generating enzyme family protein [Candidatus Cloacimonadota bacterium]